MASAGIFEMASKLYLFFSMVLRRGLSIEILLLVMKCGVVGQSGMKGVFVVMTGEVWGGKSGIFTSTTPGV